MPFRSVIFGLMLASPVTLIVGAAKAGDSDADARAPKASPENLANSWTGFYAGANGGFGGADINKDITTFDATHSSTDNLKGSPSSDGLAGGQAGYNFQSGHFVIGIEGEVDKAFVISKSK